jgi:hypothetical protein
MADLDYTPLGHFKNQYAVDRTSPGNDLLPVRLDIHTSAGVNLQDYLSPEEADLLGDALKAQAAVARGES